MFRRLRERRDRKQVTQGVIDRLAALESAVAVVIQRSDHATKLAKAAGDLDARVESLERRLKMTQEELLAGFEEASTLARRALNTAAGQNTKGRGTARQGDLAAFGEAVQVAMQTPEGRAQLIAELQSPNGAQASGVLGVSPIRRG